MPTFTYKALDAKGNEQSGTIEAANSLEAISLLRNQNLFPTKVRRIAGKEVNKPDTLVTHTNEKPPGFTHPSESISVSDKDFMFPDSPKCKLKQGMETISGYLNILGKQGKTWLVFESRENTYGQPEQTTIDFDAIRNVRRSGFFRKSLIVIGYDNQQWKFVGNVGKIGAILEFDFTNREK